MNNGLKNFIYKGYKFGIVGILSTIINYGVFAFLFKIISVHYIFSSVSGYLLGLLLGYLLNKNWTFVVEVDKSKSYIVSYVFVYFISLISSQLLLFTLVETFIINPLYANIFSIALSTLMNFLGTNFFVFRIIEKNYVR
jgi:putative flippase GtrA